MSERPNEVVIICHGDRHTSPDLDAIEADIVRDVPGHPVPGEAWRLSHEGSGFRAFLWLIVGDQHRVVPEAVRIERAYGRTRQELHSKVLAKHHNASAWVDRQVAATQKAMKLATVAEETTASGRARRALRKFCVGLPAKYRYRVAAEVARDGITDAAKIEALAKDALASWEAALARRKAAKEVVVHVEPPEQIEISTAKGPARLTRKGAPMVSALLAAALLHPNVDLRRVPFDPR